MLVVDIDQAEDEVIEDPDPDLYTEVDEKVESVNIVYVVDKEEETEVEEKELEATSEYPNGGKSYKFKIISPAVGHFDVTYEDGSPVPYDIKVLDHFPTTGEVCEEELLVRYWRKLTQEEIDKNQAEQEEQRKKIEEQREFLDGGPERLTLVEGVQDDMVLLLADIVGGAI